MEVKLNGVQVCELATACQILFMAGCGRRRTDGDHMAVYLERPDGSFYVSKENGNPFMTLGVDEGSYSGALHGFIGQAVTQAPLEKSEVGHALPWLEYVDMGDLMTVLVRKLVGEVKYESGPYIGRGKNQRFQMEQSIAHLKKWSEENPDGKLRFV